MDHEQISVENKKSPPIKVLSSQLREGKDNRLNGKLEFNIKRLGQWKNTALVVSVVWMQGTILEVRSDHNTVLLLDETGTFVVNGVNNIPKGNPCLFQGNYVMVMGMIQALSPEPVLRAVKMADLSERAAIHRRMWKLEVEDLQQTLT
ncbi:recQ-mediated genome instability protein 2-like [Salvelinus fontinalis]|uniref:recQ-mediated genome instability protein 2-like n=1 Tax=Salvelinus fontinalis TaxID=8038 RepID=UPI002486AE86|nr:recQ-mediated genome instability protein 2-like [Salvelinus fontinalis]